MPKRRTTRKNSTQPRDQDVCSTKDRTSYSDREEQKKMILKEFDADVSAALKDIKKKKKSAELALNKHYELCLSAIPSEIRHLTIKQFAALGGTFEKAVASVRKVKLNETKLLHKANLLAEIKAKCDNSTSSSNSKDTVEEESNETVAELETVRTAMRKGQRRRLRATLKTPAITPKFDPKLPATPENIRKEKVGERLMSLAGSPVLVMRNTVAKNQLEETLKECGLTPERINRVFGTFAAAVSTE